MMQPMVSSGAQRFLETIFEMEPPIALDAYQGALAGRLAIARAWSEFQVSHPLVLGPVCTAQPFPVGQDVRSVDEVRAMTDSMRLTVAVNNLGLPSVAVPVGVADGLPQGVQIIGPRYREDLCLDAGEVIEARLGVITPIDAR
jgi:amidase